MENSFLTQIKEDIWLIQNEYVKNNPLLEKEEYAFNYWVLSKLFNVDEDTIDTNITEYSDDWCDCFVFFEDSKELYLIQNKYYSNASKISEKYVTDDFMEHLMTTLDNDHYTRSVELQDIFRKYKSDPDFRIYLHFYVTNDEIDNKLREKVERYTYNWWESFKANVSAEIFWLSDIKENYYWETKKDRKNYNCIFKSINSWTVLNIDSENYHLPWLIDAKYILTPVEIIYDIVRECKEKNYMLFEENIREYLWNKWINARIATTLNNPEDRDNFFYYNNWITVICDRIDKETPHWDNVYSCRFKAYNPQIVNWCQTVNTIYETLHKFPRDIIEEDFKNTFVMVKLLVLDKEKNKTLYQDIVKYNNSQNKIDDKNFVANKQIFLDLQKYLKNYWLLLAVKQSDMHKFEQEENFNNYRPKLSEAESLFGLSFSKLSDIEVQLDKFLQVLLAFKDWGYAAYTKKPQILKFDNHVHDWLIDFIKNWYLTHKDYADLFFLFLKSEIDKKNSDDLKTPIPYYLLWFIGRELRWLTWEEYRKNVRYIFSDKKIFDTIYMFYKKITKRYERKMSEVRMLQYNKMIKTDIDENILSNVILEEEDVIFDSTEKQIINKFRNHNI